MSSPLHRSKASARRDHFGRQRLPWETVEALLVSTVFLSFVWHCPKGPHFVSMFRILRSLVGLRGRKRVGAEERQKLTETLAGNSAKGFGAYWPLYRCWWKPSHVPLWMSRLLDPFDWSTGIPKPLCTSSTPCLWDWRPANVYALRLCLLWYF